MKATVKEVSLKAGDVVRLMSGGPYMTVEYGVPYNSADPEDFYCVWFSITGDFNKQKFRADVLELV